MTGINFHARVLETDSVTVKE